LNVVGVFLSVFNVNQARRGWLVEHLHLCADIH